MKQFLSIIEKDLMRENFSRKEMITYGVIAPIVLVVLMTVFG